MLIALSQFRFSLASAHLGHGSRFGIEAAARLRRRLESEQVVGWCSATPLGSLLIELVGWPAASPIELSDGEGETVLGRVGQGLQRKSRSGGVAGRGIGAESPVGGGADRAPKWL